MAETSMPNQQHTIRPRKSTPVGLNHIVLNVRDIEASERFYTEIVGLVPVGRLAPQPGRPNPPKMRFYSVDHGDGRLSQHDVALVEVKDLPPIGIIPAVSHVAFQFPDRETWQAQLAHVQAAGIPFDARTEHGPTHSLYIRDPDGYGVELLYEMPREVWEKNIDASVNYYKRLPTEGAAALEDNADVPVFTAGS